MLTCASPSWCSGWQGSTGLVESMSQWRDSSLATFDLPPLRQGQTQQWNHAIEHRTSTVITSRVSLRVGGWARVRGRPRSVNAGRLRGSRCSGETSGTRGSRDELRSGYGYRRLAPSAAETTTRVDRNWALLSQGTWASPRRCRRCSPRDCRSPCTHAHHHAHANGRQTERERESTRTHLCTG
jgi:hypothetical protein